MDVQKNRTVLDISLQGAGLATPVQTGDILRVLHLSAVSEHRNIARQCRRNRTVFLASGHELSDIIPDSQSLITRDYWERRNQLGVPGPEFKPEYSNNPDYYPRDLNGYQTGSAQFDANGVPIYNGQNASSGTQGQQANGSRTNGPNSLPANQASGQNNDPNCIPDAS